MTTENLTTARPSNDRLYARIVRRETHSPRAGLGILFAVVLVLVIAWLGTESVLAALGLPALLVAPGDALASALALPSLVEPNLLAITGIAVAVIGLLLVIHAVAPGRRAFHAGQAGRTALVVDNRAIATDIAARVGRATALAADQVVVVVGHRTVEVRVRPTSGHPVDKDAVDAAVTAEIERLALSPALRHTVTIEKSGVVGA